MVWRSLLHWVANRPPAFLHMWPKPVSFLLFDRHFPGLLVVGGFTPSPTFYIFKPTAGMAQSTPSIYMAHSSLARPDDFLFCPCFSSFIFLWDCFPLSNPLFWFPGCGVPGSGLQGLAAWDCFRLQYRRDDQPDRLAPERHRHDCAGRGQPWRDEHLVRRVYGNTSTLFPGGRGVMVRKKSRTKSIKRPTAPGKLGGVICQDSGKPRGLGGGGVGVWKKRA